MQSPEDENPVEETTENNAAVEGATADPFAAPFKSGLTESPEQEDSVSEPDPETLTEQASDEPEDDELVEEHDMSLVIHGSENIKRVLECAGSRRDSVVRGIEGCALMATVGTGGEVFPLEPGDLLELLG